MVKSTMLDFIVLQCRYHYLSMFLTISQPPDLITEPATWHFNKRGVEILISTPSPLDFDFIMCYLIILFNRSFKYQII
jgi:hypothetical protein